jgi:phosphoesterase RecJ-like protein
VKIVSRDKVPEGLSFLKGSKKVEGTDYKTFDFNSFDLFIILDSSGWEMVVGQESNVLMPKIKTVVIDHHLSNKKYGTINLVETNAGSVCEILYLLFEDWKLELSKENANNLLAGIIADTGCFRYDNATSRSLIVGSKLLQLGANKSEIIFNLYQNIYFQRWKYWGKIFDKAKFDKKSAIVWSSLSYDEFLSLGSPNDVSVGGMFFQNVKNSKLGIYLEEREKGVTSVSLRSRADIDVSKIAVELGGGGHFRAAGASIRNLKFEDAVERVLQTARKYTKA